MCLHTVLPPTKADPVGAAVDMSSAPAGVARTHTTRVQVARLEKVGQNAHAQIEELKLQQQVDSAEKAALVNDINELTSQMVNTKVDSLDETIQLMSQEVAIPTTSST